MLVSNRSKAASLYSMSAGEGYPSLKNTRRQNFELRFRLTHLESVFSLHNVPLVFWSDKVFGDRNFLKFFFLNFDDFDLKIRDWVLARFLENHWRIPHRGYLMVPWNFQNSKFHFFLTTMKFPKNFEKKSSCSKKFFWHRKLNDGSPGYWEKSCWVSNLLLRFLKLHLKIFLKASFLEALRLFKISKNHCRHILRDFELRFWLSDLESDFLLHNVPLFFWFDEPLIL